MRKKLIIPNFIKPMVRPLLKPILRRVIYPSPILSSIYKKFYDATHYSKTLSEIHQYWMQPYDGSNLPQDYLRGELRSKSLVKIVQKYADHNARILEIGCNVGRNLNYLFLAGFKKLEGVEISKNAVQLLKQSYPEMSKYAKIHNKPIEEIIKKFKDNTFDIVFTMAVLEHIHPNSEWIFSEMVRITKGFIITIEDEHTPSWRHFPRNYKKVFESLHMKQVSTAKVEGLESNARIFRKI